MNKSIKKESAYNSANRSQSKQEIHHLNSHYNIDPDVIMMNNDFTE